MYIHHGMTYNLLIISLFLLKRFEVQPGKQNKSLCWEGKEVVKIVKENAWFYLNLTLNYFSKPLPSRFKVRRTRRHEWLLSRKAAQGFFFCDS